GGVRGGYRAGRASSPGGGPLTGSQRVARARGMVVSPKVVGLRNDTAPCHVPPTTSQAARCPVPATMSAPPGQVAQPIRRLRVARLTHQRGAHPAAFWSAPVGYHHPSLRSDSPLATCCW